MEDFIIGTLAKHFTVIPISYWDNYGIVCPELITSNGDGNIVASMVIEKLSTGWSFVESWTEAVGEDYGRLPKVVKDFLETITL